MRCECGVLDDFRLSSVKLTGVKGFVLSPHVVRVSRLRSRQQTEPAPFGHFLLEA